MQGSEAALCRFLNSAVPRSPVGTSTRRRAPAFPYIVYCYCREYRDCTAPSQRKKGRIWTLSCPGICKGRPHKRGVRDGARIARVEWPIGRHMAQPRRIDGAQTAGHSKGRAPAEDEPRRRRRGSRRPDAWPMDDSKPLEGCAQSAGCLSPISRTGVFGLAARSLSISSIGTGSSASSGRMSMYRARYSGVCILHVGCL